MPVPGSVTIVRTGVANTASVAAAFRRLEVGSSITDDSDEVLNAELLVLPGVGSFGAGMDRLDRTRLTEPIARRVEEGRPTLAICLGMQLLCIGSDESEGVPGLGCVAGALSRFESELPVPQIGWNLVDPSPDSEVVHAGFAYFANSHRLESAPPGWASAYSDYAGPFIAALEKGAVLACQFHPELSGLYGLDLLSRWLARASKEVAA